MKLFFQDSMNNKFLNELEVFTYTFLIPSICFIGCFLNLVSFLTFLRIKYNRRIFKWLMAKTLVNFVYLLQCGFIFTVKCEWFCSFEKAIGQPCTIMFLIFIYHLLLEY